MQVIGKNFDHIQAESWYQHWVERGYFSSKPDHREAYTIVIPPPNVTGILHMGHCLNNTIQDVLIRRARLYGKNACWVPGTDHASIATEAKVVQMLRERGIQKASLSRDEFLQYAWEWKEKYGGIILQQLRKLGCSLDWDRVSFTMDDYYYTAVISVFNDLYNKGYIYRGKRMINWDVKAQTALSDEEVIRKVVKQQLYHIRYAIADANGKPGETHITIATVRPETIMGDTAICVHPDDERYKHLHGKSAIIPLINKCIPIITDSYVTMDFGTGALKVTPAHDMNDNMLGQKHSLEVVDILNDDGTLSETAQIYVGEDRFAARKKIAVELQEQGFIEKIEDYQSEIGYSERNPDVVVEPRLSLQWWVSMKKIAEPALHAVSTDEIKFHPAKFKNLYRHWMENVKDWCISRQLWWGHRIPAWYDAAGNVAVANNAADALLTLQQKNPALTMQDIMQDPDCLDTWFSSWLWPFEVFKGYSDPGNADIKYYYPTQTLVTAPEIIFFWVARMVMAGYEWMGEKPFSDVYFTGIVRDELGRKMSKQLGNSPDLLGMIDKYGADAVRFGILISSPAGNDLLFDVKEESTLKQGSFFINKIWNALKLVKMWEERQTPNITHQTPNNFACNWFEQRLNEAKAEIDNLYEQFKLSEVLKTIYSLIWDDFCSSYLEWVKPAMNETIDSSVYEQTVSLFDELLLLLHPFMPFVTEEIYHQLKQRNEGDDICIMQVSPILPRNERVLYVGKQLKNDISSLMEFRAKNNIKNIQKIEFRGDSSTDNIYLQDFEPGSAFSILQKRVNGIYTHGRALTEDMIELIGKEIRVQSLDNWFYIYPNISVDVSAQKAELLKDLEYQQGFLAVVEKKLSNERFVQNAKPEVVAAEQKKKADALDRIATIEASLKDL